MVIVKDLNLWYDHEDYIESPEDYTDDDIVVIDEPETEDEEVNDDEEEIDDDDDDDDEEIKITFSHVEDMNMWRRKNYKLAVEVVGATGIDLGRPTNSYRRYYVILFNNVGIVRTTRLAIGYYNSVRWNSNELLVFPVDGLDLLKRRLEKDGVDYDDGEYEEEDEFIYFQIVRADSVGEVGTSHGHVVVGQARVNVPLFLNESDYDLDVVEPVHLGGGCKGMLRVRMLLSKMIPSLPGEEEEEKGSTTVCDDAVTVERRITTKGIMIN